MSLYQIREAIRQEMDKSNPDQARITELIHQRDALVAAENAAQPSSQADWYEGMLEATHG